MSIETVLLLTPEIVLVSVATLIYVAGAFFDARKIWSWLAGGGIVLAAIALATLGDETSAGGPVITDALAHYARWLALAVGALFVLLASRPLAEGGTPEYVGSLLLAIAGVMLVSSAGELVLLFLGLELISIPTYILLYLGRRGAQSQETPSQETPSQETPSQETPSLESTTKYFFLSILASAMLLYGFTFLYGTAGTTDLAGIGERLSERLSDPVLSKMFGPLAMLAMILIFAGLGFKIAAVPFHFYAPDVYQGTTHTNAALLSVLPKAAGLVVLIRILVQTIPGVEPRVAVVLSVLTMTLGNMMALWQNNLRRLLAYSSIAHAGYMLIGLSVALAMPGGPGSWNGLGALLFYLSVYAVATIGTFAALEYLGRRDAEVTAVDELAGLGRGRPFVAAALAVFMFSLAGIPPLAGFWGKLALFFSALSVAGESLRPWFLTLAILGGLNAAVAAAYYLRIVAVMYFRTPLAVPKAEGGAGAWSAVVVCAMLTIALGLLPRPLLDESNEAGRRAVVGTVEEETPGPGRRLGAR